MVIRNKIKEIRCRYDISIKELAQVSQLHRSTIYRIENNIVNPSYLSICILKKSINEIIGYKNEKE